MKVWHFKNARFSRTPIKLRLMLAIYVHVYLKEWPGFFFFANCSHMFLTGALNWFVGTGKASPEWKCEIKHFVYYKLLQLIYLGEQISLFIALYVFVLLWDSPLHSLFILFTVKLKVW